VVLEDGCEVHVTLPFLPHSDVLRSAFAALHFSVSGAAISRIVGNMHTLKGDNREAIQLETVNFAHDFPTIQSIHIIALPLLRHCFHLAPGIVHMPLY
jgi:hypothetical protein